MIPELNEKQKLRVAMVVPNMRWCDWDENTLWHYIPYNLCMVAAMIDDVAEVTIIDANADDMEAADFIRALDQFGPDIVGITVMMDQYADAGHKAAGFAKDHNPSVPVVLGGVYATMNPNRAMADAAIDYVIVGEGESVFKELLTSFMGRNAIPAKGVCYRKDGEILNGGHADFIMDLDELPLPAYHLLDFDRYANTAHRKSVDSPRAFPYARIMTSRGCPFGCVFCQVESISGRKFRARSADNVLDEIQWLRDTYGVQSLIFDDDNLFTDRQRAVDIFQGMLDRGLAMPWVAIAVAEFKLDETLIRLMRRSGCEFIDIAIESGSNRVLKEIIKKPVNLQHAKEMTAVARQEGIFVAANFVIGFPTETWDEIRQSLRFAEQVGVDYVKIFVAIPLRHTRLWDLCKKTGSLKNDFQQEGIRWSTGQIETDQFKSQDLTLLRAYEWDRINFSSAEKRERTAEMMGISETELHDIRLRTLKNARKLIAANPERDS